MGKITPIKTKEHFLSLKQDLNMVKEELSSEEKFFEKAVITEKFVKKYKNFMIAAVVVVVALVGTNIIYTQYEENNINQANAALATLQADASNEVALNQLQSLSPSLHDVWLFSQAVAKHDTQVLESVKNSKALLVSDLSSYELASDSQNIDTLKNYAMKENATYADLAKVKAAVILMNEDKIKDAHEELSQIAVSSPLAQVANALMHYGVK